MTDDLTFQSSDDTNAPVYDARTAMSESSFSKDQTSVNCSAKNSTRNAVIAKRFSKAAEQYQQHSQLQQQVAKALFKWAEPSALNLESTLDIGCGTGFLAQLVSQSLTQVKRERMNKPCTWLNLDISHSMLNQARMRLSEMHNSQRESISTKMPAHEHSQSNLFTYAFINGDAEQLPLKSGSQSLVCSSMAMQWCSSLERVLNEIYRVLDLSGSAVLAIMIDPSFSHLKQAWTNIGMPPRVNHFAKASDWLKEAENFDWKVSFAQSFFYTHHSSIMDMMRSLQGVGANTRLDAKGSLGRDGLSSFEPLKRTEIDALQAQFNSFNETEKCLDYQVLFLKLDK